MSERTPVLVLGSYLTALGTIRSLARSGIPSFVHGDAEPFLRASRFYRRRFAPDGTACSSQNLARLLEQAREPRLVLMPVADPWVSALAELDARADRFVSSTPPPEAIATLLDKGRLARQLLEHDVPHPRTVLAATPGEAAAAVAGMRDAFLKPRSSFAFKARFGVKAFRLRDAAAAEARARAAAEAGLEFVVQEYVPGPATCHHFVDGFIDREGVVRALFARQRLRMYPTDFGDSSALVTVPLETVSQAVEPLRRLLAALRYRGIFSAEFKRDSRDGAFRLIEVNARPWVYVEYAQRAGVNVCEMAWRDAVGLPVATVSSYRIGLRCVHERNDRQAARELIRRGELARGAWLRSWLGAHHPLLAADDPLPALADACGRLREALARPLSRGAA